MTFFHRHRGVFLFCLVFLTILVIWEFGAETEVVNGFFFSRPSEIALALKEGLLNGTYAQDSIASSVNTLKGIAYGILIAALIVFSSLKWKLAEEAANAAFGFFIYLPVLAVAPLFLVWFGPEEGLKIAIAAFLSSLVAGRTLISTYRQIQQVWGPFLSRVSARFTRSIRIVGLPEIMSGLLARVPDLVSAAFLGVFVGEFVAANEGLGYRILRAGKLYQADEVLALAFLSIIVLLAMQLALYVVGLLSLRVLQLLAQIRPE